MRRPWPLLALLLLVVGAAPAPPEGWEPAERARRFPGQGLYGHINGGAELFHEFGFVELRVRDWEQHSGATVTVERYVMDSPRAALGIYLAKCGVEQPLEDFDLRHTANPYQLTVVKGSVFLQINNPDGDAALLPAMAALAEGELAETANAGPDSLVIWLDAKDRAGSGMKYRIPGSLRFLHGPLGLSPLAFPTGNDHLELGGERWAVAARYKFWDEGGPATRIRVPIPSDEAIAACFEAFEDLARWSWNTGDGSKTHEFEDETGRLITIHKYSGFLELWINAPGWEERMPESKSWHERIEASER